MVGLFARIPTLVLHLFQPEQLLKDPLHLLLATRDTTQQQDSVSFMTA